MPVAGDAAGQEAGEPLAQAWEYSVVMPFNFMLRTLWGSGLAARFASCPPRFALLLDLRKTRNQPTLVDVVSGAQNNTPSAATGMACLLQRSQGGGRRPGDMSGSRYAVAFAG